MSFVLYQGRRRWAALALGAVVGLHAPAAWAAESPADAPPAEEADRGDAGPAFDILAYDVNGNTLLKQVEVEAAVYPFMGPGSHARDVDHARAALEKVYHDKGFQSVVVEIPPQRADDGVVRLSVVEAPVGRLRVVGSRYFSPEVVKRQAPSLVEGRVPDLTATQAENTDLNRNGDRRVTPVLRAGVVPGTVDIDLKVSDTLPLHASLSLNNDHAQGTVPERLSATVRYSNLWQLGHTISATYLTAPQRKSDAEVVAGSYMAPLWGTRWTVLVFGYNSNSDIASLGGASVLGKGYSIGVRGIRQLPAWGSASQSISLGLDYKHFDEAITLGGTSADPQTSPVTYLPVVLSYSLQRAGEKTSADLTLTATGGLRGIGSDSAETGNKRPFATGNFVHLNLDASLTRTLPYGFVGNGRVSGQFADQPLTSAEQFSAGGLNTVRGYFQSEIVGDNGVLGSLELRTPGLSPYLGSFGSRLVNEWRFYLFTDAASAWVIHPLAEQDRHLELASAGAGMRLQVLNYVNGDLMISLPLTDAPATRAGDSRVSFSLKAEF